MILFEDPSALFLEVPSLQLLQHLTPVPHESRYLGFSRSKNAQFSTISTSTYTPESTVLIKPQ